MAPRMTATTTLPAATSDLRVALFSGNYNYVRDGANQALNRLVGYLLSQGAAVRVYSPVVEHPAFPPTGDLVGVPSIAFPGRGEYLVASGLPPGAARSGRVCAQCGAYLQRHHRAPRRHWARDHNLPVLASVHTVRHLFPLLQHGVDRAADHRHPAPPLPPLRRAGGAFGIDGAGAARTADELRHLAVVARGGTQHLRSRRRDMAWRRSLGIADDDVVVGLFSRLVMEKGLDVFSDTIDELNRRGVKHRVLIVGDGPAREWFEARLPQRCSPASSRAAIWGGGGQHGCAVLPSITETFGNVTLEAMACGLPVVCAAATGSEAWCRMAFRGG
jgi:glycosyltransferase involved in cell wall biosynthesis